MKEKFLKARHWQIFLITFAIPFFIQIFMIPVVMLTEIPWIMLLVLPVVIALYLGGFMGWLWSISMGVRNKIPSGVEMKVRRFKLFFFYPLIYLPLFVIGIILFAGSLVMSGGEPDLASIGLAIAIIVPLHFFAVFCMFYCLYFASKTIKTAELQREVDFSDYAGEFFLLWFYPIGVWFVQPKVNALAE